MKRKTWMPLLILTLVLALALAGCKSTPVVEKPTPNEDPDKVPGEVVEESERKQIMKELTDMINHNKEVDIVIEHVDKNINKLSQLEGDQMIHSLETTLKSNIESLKDEMVLLDKEDQLIQIGATDFYFPESKIEEIKNKDLKNLITKSYDNMYRLINLEGEYYPIIDYDKLRIYNSNITEEFKEYIGIMAMDSEMTPFADASFAISFDELSDRIIKTENYLKKYVDGERQEEMLGSYQQKFAAYLNGLPNTPLADRNTNVVFDDVLASYENTSKIENSITANVVSRYLVALKSNDNKIDNSIKELADDLFKEAIDLIKEHK